VVLTDANTFLSGDREALLEVLFLQGSEPGLQARQSSRPEPDGRGKSDGGEKGIGAPVVTGSAAAPFLQPAEDDPGSVVPPTAPLAVAKGLAA
jgi:hypothetical protein